MTSNATSEPARKRMCNEEQRDKSTSFIAREYQIEILEAARKKNTIACLGTGTGKTFIAVLLIRENSNNVRLPFLSGGKRIFFLVPTVPLVNQQRKAIQDHTDLRVKGYFGEMDVDSWSKEDWIKEFNKNEVLVMTAEIFRIIIEHAFISPKQIELLILDECHRAQKNSPYRQAMKYFHDKDRNELPRIFGLSASLLNGKCKPVQLEKRMKELESTLLSVITTASDIADLQKYGTDPDEFVVYYSNYENSAANLLNETKSFSEELAVEKSEHNKIELPYSDPEIVFFEKPLKCFNSLGETLSTLGPWCAYIAAEIYLKEIKILLNRPFSEKYQDYFTKISNFLDYFMNMCSSLNGGSTEADVTHMPDKLKRLIEIFSAAKKSDKFKSNEFQPAVSIAFKEDPEKYVKLSKEGKLKKASIPICSIIFVEQRISAYVLYQWLLQISGKYPDLNFLRPDFIVGHGCVGLSETMMSEKLQRKKVRAFKDRTCNVLIATSVLEEGMDIRQCNLVVRFDLPKDFRSYVQSKGRARAKNSVYVLMVEDKKDNSSFLQDVCNFKTIEKLLLSKCLTRTMPTEEEIGENMADNALPPYMPSGVNGPRITMSSAISLINRYCASLPSDMATKLVPQWKIEKVDPDNKNTEYICSLKMPINSPLRKVIKSEQMRKKQLAKMSAALKACQLLHEIDELNEDLVPISHLVEKALEEELGDKEEDDDEGGAQPGTNRRRQIYEKRVPVFLRNAKPVADEICYLHVINMDLINPLPQVLNPRRRPIIDPKASSRGLGLLFSSRLPPVNPFPIFTKFGKIMISINLFETKIILTPLQLKMVEEFHRFVFCDVLWLEKGKTFSPNEAPSSYYITPIKNQENMFAIDWEFIDLVEKDKYHDLRKGNCIPRDFKHIEENSSVDCVLMRSYKRFTWEAERPTFHHVIKVENNMSPKDYVDSEKIMNFKEYYFKKYNVEINIDDQPLVETVQYAALDYWKPIYVSPKETFEESTLSKSKQRRRDYRELLVPELCLRHPFPSSFFLKVIYIPTVLFRLHSLLLAEEIRQSVRNEIYSGIQYTRSWPPFHLETRDKSLRKHLYEKGLLEKENPKIPILPQDIIKNDNYISKFVINYDLSRLEGPSPCLLLQALTTKSAGDEFDLERLEMIGDSFLKYSMSIKIYIKYYNFDEGKLSSLRSKLIQNLNLYQKAKKKNLGQYLTTACFSCNNTWLPPCYNIDEVIDKSFKIKGKKVEGEVEIKNPLHQYFTRQIISDKSIADSVEALIGAYLLTYGPIGALKFMSWLGLKPLVNENDILDNWPPPSPSPFVSEAHEPEKRLTSFIKDLNRFEEIIGYSFKNKGYLLQAFTHPSYSYNDITECYQRLEFLGDAVLDYLITRQLYEDPHEHSPGKLTDLRSALVNNIFFASLAVKKEYHKFLRMLSPNLFRLMNHYIDLLCESEHYKYFEEHGYYLEEIECFELEEVEVPKALGDIFESVAGAIFLDSGMSLDTVWRVYFPLIKPALDHLSQSVPMSPVRELYELVRAQNLFREPFEKNDRTYIELVLPDGRKYEGVGPNKKVAKRSAAKRAVADLKKKKKDGCLMK